MRRNTYQNIQHAGVSQLLAFCCTEQDLIIYTHQLSISLCPEAVVCMQSNIDNTTNWALSDEEYKAITGIKHQLRLLDGYPWLHPDGPYRLVKSLHASTSAVKQLCTMMVVYSCSCLAISC